MIDRQKFIDLNTFSSNNQIIEGFWNRINQIL